MGTSWAHGKTCTQESSEQYKQGWQVQINPSLGSPQLRAKTLQNLTFTGRISCRFSLCWVTKPKGPWSLFYPWSDPPAVIHLWDHVAAPHWQRLPRQLVLSAKKQNQCISVANKKGCGKKNIYNKERKEEIKTVPWAQLPARRSTVCYIAYNAVFYPASSSQGPVNRTLFQNLPPLPVFCAMYWHCSAGLSKKLV